MSKFRPSILIIFFVSISIVATLVAFVTHFSDRFAIKHNVSLVTKVIPAAQTSMPNMDLPDAIDLSFYMDENQIALSKVGGRVPVILAAEFSTGQLDPVQEKEHQTGDLVLYSDGRVAKLWYFDQDNTMVRVNLRGYMAANNSNY